MDPLVGLYDIGKRFGGTHTLTGVTLEVRPGTVHALVGANGAGKSTLLKILSGALRPDAGELRVEGRDVSHRHHLALGHSWALTPATARLLGIVMVHQETALVPQLTPLQNVSLGMVPTRFGVIRGGLRRRDAARALAEVGFKGAYTRPVRDLAITQAQLVEIAKALAVNAKVIAFDEPTAALSPGEARHLFAIIRKLRKAGHGTLYVSHRLEEVLELSDDITVLRGGRVVERYSGPEIRQLTTKQLVRDMMGDSYREYVATPHMPARPHEAKPALHIEHLSGPPAFRDVSFSVWPGEILGVFGLVGAGRSELLRAIVGLEPASGSIQVNGKRLVRHGPREAIGAGITYLPEDRKSQGLVLGMPIATNVTLPYMHGKAGYLSRSKQAAEAWKSMQAVNLHRRPDELVKNLSGGTQQKVLVARSLLHPFSVYLFDEPTRGIDVHTKAEIYGFIERIAQSGAAVVVVSSEVEEITRLSHRVMVMHEGSVSAFVSSMKDIEHADLLALASGIHESRQDIPDHQAAGEHDVSAC